jgi:predicted O-methyltransferase YrrM
MLIEEYIEKYTSPEAEILKELNRETHLKILRPRMLSGHIQGEFLKMLSRFIKPNNILEIGTYTGYSAICLAEGLSENGKLYTIEKNFELEDIIRKYIKKANLEDKILLYIGDATKIIPDIDKMFDIIFIDADKQNYTLYYNMTIDKLRSGGCMIVDNVLWNGKVLDELKPNDYETKGIIDFNERIRLDNRIEHLLLPQRDGLIIIYKK